jgi:hypothetical protein
MKNDQFSPERAAGRLCFMSTAPETAVILDFAAYRAKRAERARGALATPRRFLWSWPSTGQMMLVDFPALGGAFLQKTGSPQSPGG